MQETHSSKRTLHYRTLSLEMVRADKSHMPGTTAAWRCSNDSVQPLAVLTRSLKKRKNSFTKHKGEHLNWNRSCRQTLINTTRTQNHQTKILPVKKSNHGKTFTAHVVFFFGNFIEFSFISCYFGSSCSAACNLSTSQKASCHVSTASLSC